MWRGSIFQPFQQQQPRGFVPITSYQNEVNYDGSYAYSYISADGSQQQARGYVKNLGQKEIEAQVVQGLCLSSIITPYSDICRSISTLFWIRILWMMFPQVHIRMWHRTARPLRMYRILRFCEIRLLQIRWFLIDLNSFPFTASPTLPMKMVRSSLR